MGFYGHSLNIETTIYALRSSVNAENVEGINNIYHLEDKAVEYDFAIISHDNPISCIRRADVVKFLIYSRFRVKIIGNLWKKDRDKEIIYFILVFLNNLSNFLS